MCEICSASESTSKYELSSELSVNLCGKCQSQIENPATMDEAHWQCLATSMWSENPAAQVLTYRLLTFYKKKTWAQELLEQMYLDDALVELALSDVPKVEAVAGDDREPTLDSNGARLADGDSVTLIKDLDVKGGGFTAKRGTLVKGITLTDNPEHIEGRVNGVHIVLVTKYLKKA